ncbi:MAG: Mth938-like domain-containing protein [Burkholderiales bacterium]|nr:Mth938-like domain-containing protein [Burkholderiales bacterium]
MKFQPETAPGANVITRHEPGRVWVANQAFGHSIVVPWGGEIKAWGATRFEDLSEAHFEALAALQPELVIFGSGARLRFARPQWLRPLIERRIGVESMDTPAACRTYNVLVSELRSVVAALLLEPTES